MGYNNLSTFATGVAGYGKNFQQYLDGVPTKTVRLTNIEALAHIDVAVLACDGGTHYSPLVVGAHLSAGIDSIVALDGATVNDPSPALVGTGS